MNNENRGTLFLCATPIGNLGDITERVLETLRSVDLIAAEDTRNSVKLLTHFDIHTPMTSYHEYNKFEKADELIAKMQTGIQIALITDAGTPAISDPGQVLVDKCHEAGIPVTSLPGPCACITALTLSGLDSRRFIFEGFLPEDKKGRMEVLESLKNEPRTVIFYAAPHDLRRVLKLFYENLGDRRLALCRELTKKFEEVKRMTLSEAVSFYENNDPRGEYVLVLAGRDRQDLLEEKRSVFAALPVSEHVARYEAEGMDRKSAMKKAAEDRGISKREIYQMLLEKEQE